MDDILTTILALVSVAVVIAGRIAGARKKRQGEPQAGRSKLEEYIASLVEDEPDSRADAGSFDAHSLSVDEDAKAERFYAPRPAVPVAIATAGSRSYPMPAGVPVNDAPSLTPGFAAAAEIHAMEVAPIVPMDTSRSPFEAKSPAPKPAPSGDGAFGKGIDGLPPLKKAIVMAELLGSPLGLR